MILPVIASFACQSNEGTSTSQTTSDGKGDPIAGSDADRASAELDAQKEEREDRGRRPSQNNPRGGTRSVDQPRVGGRP
ncbi:MAG: hypothetical protein IPK83_16090 [Planctomycetes bacterium]|nr:hypothetical protein [Planctomycetota bacterium]